MENEERDDKTILLRVINVIQILVCLITSAILCINNEISKGVVVLILGFVIFAFMKGFQDVIDLLDNINRKLK